MDRFALSRRLPVYNCVTSGWFGPFFRPFGALSIAAVSVYHGRRCHWRFLAAVEFVGIESCSYVCVHIGLCVSLEYVTMLRTR